MLFRAHIINKPIQQTILILVLSFFALTQTASAQVGKQTRFWKWTDRSSHHDAVVKVSTESGSGAGVLVRVDKQKPYRGGYLGYCLTARHVVIESRLQVTEGVKQTSAAPATKIKVTYQNGRVATGCKIVADDKDNDVAVLWVWVPRSIEPARVASRTLTDGKKIEFAGLGGGSKLRCCIRHFSAKASHPTNSNRIFADVALLPGDSGGPVFNENREVVGIISGGWFWWDGEIKTDRGNPIKATWPARACNVDPIQKLLSEIDSPKAEIVAGK